MMSRTEAVALVGRVIAGDHASEDELDACLDPSTVVWPARPATSAI